MYPCANGVVVIAVSLYSEVPGLIPERGKKVPMNTLVCSFVELSLAFSSLSGHNFALASHPRMGQSHNFELPSATLCLFFHGALSKFQSRAFRLSICIGEIGQGRRFIRGLSLNQKQNLASL